jgi:glycosyltransferase involved in cell wall biosynthesis
MAALDEGYKMKILLTMHMPYFPSFGGANKNNRLIAECLAEKGHDVLAVVPALGTEPGQLTQELFLKEQKLQGIQLVKQGDIYKFHWNKVKVHAIDNPNKLSSYLKEQIQNFSPDCLLIALEEPEQILLETALRTCRAPVVGIAQTPSLLPFGSDSFFPSSAKTELIKRATAVIASSNFLSKYIRKWSGIEAKMIHMPVYGSSPFPHLRNYKSEFITMINPCHIKGIDIFLQIAIKMPELQFAAIPTWGTSEEDKKALSDLSNVSILEPCSNIDLFLSRSRSILMPSIWIENFPLTIIESMVRGIPVIASNIGGIPEAKMGTDFLMPVNPIEGFTFSQKPDGGREFNPIIPKQDVDPWINSIKVLLEDSDSYYIHSENMRQAALKFVQSLDINILESFLLQLI